MKAHFEATLHEGTDEACHVSVLGPRDQAWFRFSEAVAEPTTVGFQTSRLSQTEIDQMFGRSPLPKPPTQEEMASPTWRYSVYGIPGDKITFGSDEQLQDAIVAHLARAPARNRTGLWGMIVNQVEKHL